MKIGDEVFVHGFIDEIRNGTIIIKNDGGYFGTVMSELRTSEPIKEDIKWFDPIRKDELPDKDGEYLVESTRGYEVAYYRKKEGQFGLMFFNISEVKFVPIKVYQWMPIPGVEE